MLTVVCMNDSIHVGFLYIISFAFPFQSCSMSDVQSVSTAWEQSNLDLLKLS